MSTRAPVCQGRKSVNVFKDSDQSFANIVDEAWHNALKKPILTRSGEIELFKEVEKGSRAAKDQIVELNLKLVVSISNHFLDRGLSRDDLIQSGIDGLITAINKFDYRRGYKFSTYATLWIRQSIVRDIQNTSRMIRLPRYICEDHNHLSHIQNKLNLEFDHEPTIKEITARYNQTQPSAITCSQAEMSLYPTLCELSLDQYNEDGQRVGDLFGNNQSVNPEDQVSCNIDQVIATMRQVLSAREVFILDKRLGLSDDTVWPLHQLAETLHLSNEGVRQAEKKAIKKLRQAKRHFEYLLH